MRKAKNWRKIVVENKTYRYKIGNSNIVIQDENGKRVGSNHLTHRELHGRPDSYRDDDEGYHRMYPITPADIEQYIWKHT